ncbi:hypothetical protein HPB47_003484 [Ixodes persulcatus]|uniref:Uncharacterized protein n=1 Tax=Ixodes persulcatus TaxID=34615 RepID=A0AC60PIC2_IXOPE|nr:hypothetical protein HPB47_003484 [Ixodes persulcatus]
MSSSYFRKFEEPARNRYREKLTIAGLELPDPLDADRKNVFSTYARQWPRLEVSDIYVYLVEGICFYTREQFKSYKLEDGCNLFLSATRPFTFRIVVCGEACSHVATLLFRVEVDVKFGIYDPSSASVECRWIAATSTAQESYTQRRHGHCY